MFYIYRFMDEKNKIIYIGKTNDLERRINKHFSDGHLELWQYEAVHYIEYMILDTEADQHISEIYLINKYNPIFNTRDKKEDVLNLELNLVEDWKFYKMIKGSKDIDTIIKEKYKQIDKLKKEIRKLQLEEYELKINKGDLDEKYIITLFLRDCVSNVEGEEIRAKDLYLLYKEWALNNEQYILTNTSFGKEVGLILEKRRTKHGNIYKNIAIKNNRRKI